MQHIWSRGKIKESTNSLRPFTRPDNSSEIPGCQGTSRYMLVVVVVDMLVLIVEKGWCLQIFMHLRHYTRPVFQVRHTHTPLDTNTGISV